MRTAVFLLIWFGGLFGLIFVGVAWGRELPPDLIRTDLLLSEPLGFVDNFIGRYGDVIRRPAEEFGKDLTDLVFYPILSPGATPPALEELKADPGKFAWEFVVQRILDILFRLTPAFVWIWMGKRTFRFLGL